MSETGEGYHPPTTETKVERQEVSKSPDVVPGLNDGVSPTPPPAVTPLQDDQPPQDTTSPTETPAQRRLGKMGMSSMQGDVSDEEIPASVPIASSDAQPVSLPTVTPSLQETPQETGTRRINAALGQTGMATIQDNESIDDQTSPSALPTLNSANNNQPTIMQPGNWSLPPNVSPSEIKVYHRSDGKTQIIYGNERDESGQITGDHGHTVINGNSKIDYARTQNGTVKKDSDQSIKDESTLQESQLQPAKVDTKGQIAIQGWSAKDGTGAHDLYETAVEDALDETATRDGVCREVSSEMMTSAGEIDTYIQKGNKGLVIDYKTHDMSNWTVSNAQVYGKEHGQQIQQYMTAISQDTASYSVPFENLTGYVVAVNKLPKNPQALQTYLAALNFFGVSFISSDGNTESVTKTVTDLTKKHKVF